MAELEVDEFTDNITALDGLDLILRALRHLADAPAQLRYAELQPVEADGLHTDAEFLSELLVGQERFLLDLLQEELLTLLLLDPCHAFISSPIF